VTAAAFGATLARLRGICLALPEAVEKETWQAPTFRIRGKIFAMVHDTGGRPGVWCKAPPGAQTILIEADPSRFFRPPYVGPKGWIGVWLDAGLDWAEMADLIGRSYRMTAPKRLLAAANPAAATPAEKRPRRRRTTVGR
jgi:predicted DNA-binding protein (MmcQ/YjbR family)